MEILFVKSTYGIESIPGPDNSFLLWNGKSFLFEKDTHAITEIIIGHGYT